MTPAVWLLAVILLIMSSVASFLYGKGVGESSVFAEQFKQLAENESKNVKLQIDVEDIASSVASTTAVALNKEISTAQSSVRRIREVSTAEPCRNVDPLILRELQTASESANDTLRNGLRSIATRTDPGNPVDSP